MQFIVTTAASCLPFATVQLHHLPIAMVCLLVPLQPPHELAITDALCPPFGCCGTIAHMCLYLVRMCSSLRSYGLHRFRFSSQLLSLPSSMLFSVVPRMRSPLAAPPTHSPLVMLRACHPACLLLAASLLAPLALALLMHLLPVVLCVPWPSSLLRWLCHLHSSVLPPCLLR